MRTFLEYAVDVDQVTKMLADMRANERSARPNGHESPVVAGKHLAMIMGHIPEAYLDKLPDNARADLAFLLVTILAHHFDQWDQLKLYIRHFWDQPVQMAGKTLGKELLNRVSAATRDHTDAPFFISYSGPLSKHSLFVYTQKYPKVVISKKNYGYGTFDQVEKAVQLDYAENFNNSRELEKQIK